MEYTENTPNVTASSSAGSLTISEEIKRFLTETTKWMKFLSILGFIGLGLMVLAAIVIMVFGATFGAFGGNAIGALAIGLIYLVMAVLYFFPVLYLYKCSTNIQQGLNSNNQTQVNYGFENLKSHFKFIGIMMIVIISMYLLFAVLGIVMLALA